MDAEFIPSGFGGGWLVPVSPTGFDFAREYFGGDPLNLFPLGDQAGYIVEPNEAEDIAESAANQGVNVEIEQ